MALVRRVNMEAKLESVSTGFILRTTLTLVLICPNAVLDSYLPPVLRVNLVFHSRTILRVDLLEHTAGKA
jgi:hypothetical protein